MTLKWPIIVEITDCNISLKLGPKK